jgi:hypothetical protein
MTNEEIIQEILYEANEHGLMREVITEARKIMDENPKIDKVVAYEQAFNEWIK